MSLPNTQQPGRESKKAARLKGVCVFIGMTKKQRKALDGLERLIGTLDGWRDVLESMSEQHGCSLEWQTVAAKIGDSCKSVQALRNRMKATWEK